MVKRREKLRTILALAIADILGQHSFTIPNVHRYVLPYLSLYRIPRKQVKPQDILVALDLVRQAQTQNPLIFFTSNRSDWVAKRRASFLDPLKISLQVPTS